ncbi:ATP-dependent helicase [Microcystis aeruginosa CS-564/01]|uniref:ATP-dependent helicase n=1 Tax=Microcystis aeruginosa TaxID=1126 RepID=UPI00232E6CBE|nr:ATP-dependent helicase [Microcystis aeruginosa]MDB9425579.1 ATP-dependent helicase [Microcystis aeruginosa CS-564/01]
MSETKVINRENLLVNLRQQLRAGQQELADWQGGKMAISAVPGAGKSHSLAVAAAMVIAREQLHAKKQLIIVTYTRSAAASIKAKIKQRLQDLQLSAQGFSVQTLHGLALQLARRYPELSALDLESSTLVIPTPSHRIIRNSVEKWLIADPIRYQKLLEGVEFDGEETERLRRQSVLRTEILPSLAYAAIHELKSSGLSPQQVWELSHYTDDNYQILAMASGLYQQYEILMRQKNYIDYDDMILGALRVLEEEKIRRQWQKSVFGVFEDEAQDSSPLQEKLITILAKNNDEEIPNLIRVGDPNQAINSTFTPADPVYFNWFCESCQNEGNLSTMNQAGRSNTKIIEAANLVLQWVDRDWKQGKDNHKVTEAPFRVQAIIPVGAEDPQPNPVKEGKGLEIYQPDDIYQTVELIEKRLVKLLQENPQHNAAILVRENRQGHFFAQKFAHFYKSYQIRIFEANEIDRFSQIPAEMLKLLAFVERPHSPDYLKAALEVLQLRGLITAQDLNPLVTYPEQFLYPTPLDPELKSNEKIARRYCCSLLKARLELPHYQLLSFFAMTLQYSGSELATLQKLTARIYQETAGNSSLKNTINTLNEIIASERFEGVEEDNDDCYTRPGQLTIITMHKAKGLDWDYVFIPFLHEDIIPGKPWVPNGAKFLGDFTLAEVARAQIRAAVHQRYLNPDSIPIIPPPLSAWLEAGQLKKAEEYRLLYVAMTRAKRLLWMSSEKKAPFRWNTFRGDESSQLQDKNPCPVFPVLINAFPDSFCV